MGYILYEGPSELTGRPIVAILTESTSNAKTGNLLQTWILDARVDPLEASRTGSDGSVCGTCPLKGEPVHKASGWALNRGCYVDLVRGGPLAIYRAYRAGKYATIEPDRLRAFVYRKGLRLGSFGDPAAVPMSVWTPLLKVCEFHTSYTHVRGSSAELFSMVSVETHEQATDAWSKGLRTYRTVASTNDIDTSTEVLCPASKESETSGFMTCAQCRLCNGATGAAKSVAIVVHGVGKGHAVKLVTLAA